MSDDALPRSDQIDGAPHPRETTRLFGQETAEANFMEAFNGDRLHHGWLITGPRGVGKATLAWRIARFLIATPNDDGGMFAPARPENLDIPVDHSVNRRILAESEPGIFSLRRPYDPDKKKLKAQITVDEVRKLKGFFGLSATDGGRRVVIVDTADEMNVNAANALLKLLEEPPERTYLLLISHQPSKLLPTIRSRCRELRCTGLEAQALSQALLASGAQDVDTNALSQLAGGSVGEAMALMNLDGLKLYQRLVNIAGTFPRFDRPMAAAMGELMAARGADEKFALMGRLVDTLLNRLARAGLGLIDQEAIPGELDILRRLSADANAARLWSEVSHTIAERLRHGRGVNLDPAALVLDMVVTMNDTARRTAA
ncbi:MAG: DNA polymerase III subunit delta' [Litoreibacter sp.]